MIGDHDLGWVAYPLTILWIAFLANLVNLIDGMDALAAGIVAIAAGAFALLAVSFGRADAAALAAIVCGATLAFLRRNYHPAKIFMGDCGALALGFLLATIAVQGVLKTAATIALVGAAARDGGADPRHVVRRAQAAQVPPRAVGRRPQPLLPPLHADRLLAAAHGRVPARVGRCSLAGYAILLRFVPAAAVRRLGSRQHADRRRRAGWSCSPRRSGWSTRSRSSSPATCRSLRGKRREPEEDHEEAVEQVLTAGRR